MRKKALGMTLVLVLLVSGLGACKPTKSENLAQPEMSMFQPITLDTNPPRPMLYYIPFWMGQAEVGIIVNEKWEMMTQLSPNMSCWYIYDWDAEPETKEHIRFLCISEILNENYDSKLSVYDMEGNYMSQLSDLRPDGNIVDNHLVVGEWGEQGILDLETGQLSLNTAYDYVELIGPNLARVIDNDQVNIVDFSGKLIYADIGSVLYSEGVLIVDMEGNVGIMSLSGQWIVPPIYRTGGKIPQYFCNGYIVAIRNEDNMLVFINKNGEVEESAFGIVYGKYPSCETFADLFVIYAGLQPQVIDKDRITIQELQPDDQLFYANGYYFLLRDFAQSSLYAFNGDLHFVEVFSYYINVIQRGSDQYAAFLQGYGSNYSVFKIEGGKLTEMDDPIFSNVELTADGRFLLVTNGTSIGLIDYDGSWVFKTYKFYYLDDAYAEAEETEWA